MGRKLNHIGLILIFIALIIRVLDGFRSPLDMDEMPILYNVAHFFKDKTIIPAHFSYPTFFSYLIIFPVAALFLLYYLLAGYPLSGLFDLQWMSFLFSFKLSLLVHGGRFVSICFTLCTIYLVFHWGWKRFGLGAGLIAGFILALDPCCGRYVSYSRLCVPDVTAAFWVTLGMILCFEFVEKGRIKLLSVSAFVLGFAINTKYNAGMALIPLLAALVIKKEGRNWKTILSTGGSFVLGFLIASPGWLIVPHLYIDGYLLEARHMTEGHLGAHAVDWLWVYGYLKNCNTLILPIIMLAVGYSIFKHEKGDILFLLLIVPSFLYIGQFEKKAIHYFLFLYPTLALYIGRSVQILGKRIRSRIGMTLFIAVCSVLFVFNPLYRLSRMVRRDMMKDNRHSAEAWIEDTIPQGARIMVDRLTLQNLVDIEESQNQIRQFRASGSSFLVTVQQFYRERSAYRIVDIRDFWDDIEAFEKVNVNYIVISSSNYRRFFTANPNQIPGKSSPLYEEFHKKKTFYTNILEEDVHPYRLIKRFATIAGPEIRIYRHIDLEEQET